MRNGAWRCGRRSLKTGTGTQVGTNPGLPACRAYSIRSILWSEFAPPVTLAPIQRHSLLSLIRLVLIHTRPAHILKERTPCVSSAHVLGTCWIHARTKVFSQVISYGGGVHVHVSRQLHRLYAAWTPNLVSLETWSSC